MPAVLNMRTRLKICCISTLEEAELAVSAGADALGLVGDMPSGPGVISDDMIRQIAREIPPPISSFLLTRETAGRHIAEHARSCHVDTVQIVNHIAAEEYPTLIELLPNVRRVQVIHVEDDTALELIDRYSPYVHAFLLDSGSPSATVPILGGTGRVHNWAVSKEFVKRSSRPVFLAGGLTSDNVASAIDIVRPYGLDLCSGVRSDGKLDAHKLREYIVAARKAEHASAFN